MLYSFSKFTQPVFWPFNLFLIAVLATLILLRRNRPRIAFRLLLGAVVLFSIICMPVTSNLLRRSLETYYRSRAVLEYPSADAIVVLGGTMGPLQGPRHEPEEVSGTRVVPAWRLYRAKKAPLVVLSSGWEYRADRGETRTESQDMRDFLVDLGVPDSSLRMENKSRNTYENAIESARILIPLGKRRILLVTSAFHMRRSIAMFAAQGFDAVAVPTGHMASTTFEFSDLIPDLGGLVASTQAIKEYVGLAVYSVVHRVFGRTKTS